jgi:hypothetical protein
LRRKDRASGEGGNGLKIETEKEKRDFSLLLLQIFFTFLRVQTEPMFLDFCRLKSKVKVLLLFSPKIFCLSAANTAAAVVKINMAGQREGKKEGQQIPKKDLRSSCPRGLSQ